MLISALEVENSHIESFSLGCFAGFLAFLFVVDNECSNPFHFLVWVDTCTK